MRGVSAIFTTGGKSTWKPNHSARWRALTTCDQMLVSTGNVVELGGIEPPTSTLPVLNVLAAPNNKVTLNALDAANIRARCY